MNQRELRNRMWQAAEEALSPDEQSFDEDKPVRVSSCAVDKRAFLVITDREVYRVTVEVL